MKNKTFCFFMLIIAVVLFAAAGILFLNSKTPQPLVNNNENQAEKNSNNSNNLEISVVPFSQTDAFYNIHSEYPQFKAADSTFNAKIASLVANKIAGFEKDAKDNWDARKATASPGEIVPDNPPSPFDFILTWTPDQLNAKYISFVMNIYYFTGGAHGSNEIYTFNYDIAQKKEITINDFLKNSTTAFQNLAKISSQDVESQLQSSGMQIDSNLKSMISDGVKPTAENYQNFTFDYNSLTIYFQQYQVAPGSAGSIKSIFFEETLNSNSINSNYLN